MTDTCMRCKKQTVHLFGGYCIECDTAEPMSDSETATAATIAPSDGAPFGIDSMERLNWYLRKVGNLQAEKARIKAQAATLLTQIDSDLNRLTQHFGQQVETFTRQELERKGGKRKSLVTLQGTCSFRAVPSRLRLSDENEATLWAYEQGRRDLFRVEYKATPDFLDAAKVALEETGEILPGFEQTEARESFSISFPKE